LHLSVTTAISHLLTNLKTSLPEMRAEQSAMREDITSLREEMKEMRAKQHALA
jgi:hypothetical protein